MATAHSSAAILYSDCGRGLVPKDAEVIGREDMPLLDFSSKQHSIGGITMHPLRKLRESAKPTAAQVSELLAENIVFNSPILVRPIEGRDVCAAIFAQSSSTRGSGNRKRQAAGTPYISHFRAQ